MTGASLLPEYHYQIAANQHKMDTQSKTCHRKTARTSRNRLFGGQTATESTTTPTAIRITKTAARSRTCLNRTRRKGCLCVSGKAACGDDHGPHPDVTTSIDLHGMEALRGLAILRRCGAPLAPGGLFRSMGAQTRSDHETASPAAVLGLVVHHVAGNHRCDGNPPLSPSPVPDRTTRGQRLYRAGGGTIRVVRAATPSAPTM